MRILLLSFYYEPDLCAGSFRTTALVKQLKQLPNVNIDVITTMPNRYDSFEVGALEEENEGLVKVRRIKLPPHKSGMRDQIQSFYAYYKSAKKLVKNESYDMVFATSSRLFTAFLGARVADNKKIPLYLDIRDIFVDTIKDVLPGKVALMAKPVFSMIERYTFKRAKHINLVSEGFRNYFEKRYPDCQYSWFTNGIDETFLKDGLVNQKKQSASGLVTILYAGNIGEGQGLHNIIPKLASKLTGKAVIKVIGAGGRLSRLEQSIVGVDNVEICKPVSREGLIEEYNDADVLFLHLNDYPAFKKVLPSKIFEYAAMGKPILAGVSGYSAQFLKKYVSNVGVFHPTNEEQALHAFSTLELETIERTEFKTKFSRSSIMKAMAEDIYAFSNRECK